MRQSLRRTAGAISTFGLALTALLGSVSMAQAGWAVGVATASKTTPADLVLKSTEGESVVLDGGSCYGACFSPDLSEVAYVRGVDIYVIGVDGANSRRVKAGNMSTSGSAANTLSWCTDGYLYYSRGWSIYRHRADGSGSEERVHTSKFAGDGDEIRQLQVCRSGARGASWGRPNGDGHCILYPIGNPSGDKRYSNHCMGAVSKSGTYFNATFGSHQQTGIFEWSRAPGSITNNPNAPDELGIGAYTVLSRRSASTIWMVRFSQCDEDYLCWIEGSQGYVVQMSTGATVGSWSGFCPQDYTIGDLSAGGGPIANLVSPQDGSSWLPGATVPLEAQATAGDAAIEEVRFLVDGAVVATRTQAPYTASWTVDREGQVTVAVVVIDAAGETATRTATIQIAGMYAYPDSTPHALPCRIEAEHFDYGGKGIAYHDSDAGNDRGTFRADEDVDIVDEPTRRVVTKTREGEWLKYSISVPADGPYTIVAAVANGLSSGAFHLEVDNQDVTGPIQGSTGGYDVWQELIVEDITLAAGEHVLTLVFDETGHIIDYLDIRAPTPAITVLSPNGGERLSVGDSLVVTWRCDTTQVNDVFVQMSTNDGESWFDLTVGGSIDTDDPRWGRFAFPVSADLVSDFALVRVVEYGGSRNDASDAAFSVGALATGSGASSRQVPGADAIRARRNGPGFTVDGGASAGRADIMLIDLCGRVRALSGSSTVDIKPGMYVLRATYRGKSITATTVIPR